MIDVPQTLDHKGILGCIPHQGKSCLLDALCFWDMQHIVCETRSHLLEHHPYRIDGRLPAVCAVEYAAQAFALHSWLKAKVAGIAVIRQNGYLASVRGFSSTSATLDVFPGTLRIEAKELLAERGGVLYVFNLQHESTVFAQGRATIAFPREMQ